MKLIPVAKGGVFLGYADERQIKSHPELVPVPPEPEAAPVPPKAPKPKRDTTNRRRARKAREHTGE